METVGLILFITCTSILGLGVLAAFANKCYDAYRGDPRAQELVIFVVLAILVIGAVAGAVMAFE